MKIALLGGSFDPPHLAHQLACLYLLEGEGFDQVWLLPCFRHAFGKTPVDFQHRVLMCALAARMFGGRVVVSEVEQELARQDGNRTIDTVAHLQSNRPDDQFTLVIGSDILDELGHWKDVDELKKRVPFLVLQRAGSPSVQSEFPVSRLTLPEISSSQIRERLQQHKPVLGLVSQSVSAYIEQHSLYG